MKDVENSRQKRAPGSGMELNLVFKGKNTLGTEMSGDLRQNQPSY